MEEKPGWKYVYFCEHCGEFEIPIWGLFDGLTRWCQGCGDDEVFKFVEPPKDLEKVLRKVNKDVQKVRDLIRERNLDGYL